MQKIIRPLRLIFTRSFSAMPFRFLLIIGLMLPTLLLRAQEPWKVEPGKRVGPITAYSSLSTLQALFGRDKVKDGKLPAAEGETVDGARIQVAEGRELEVIWAPDAAGKRISEVSLLGKTWKLDNGLRLGLGIEEVEKINGKPFTLSGFDWDYGGYAFFDDGALGKGLTVRFSPTEENYSLEIVGEKKVPSSSAALRAAHPLVVEITVRFEP